jgi:N-dimethylarginine dimethylaminohydrolase
VSASSLVKKVLVCRPSHFDVEYVINPYMQPYSVDHKKALNQWQKLVETIKSLDIMVEVIEQQAGVPDMVFATDQGIVRDGAILLANFRYTQRQKERVYYREWFREHGFRLRALSNAFPFEGGDTLFFNDMLFVGTGFRASLASCDELASKLEVDVIPLRLVDPFFYHLDMSFLPINATTAFYYPPAYSNTSRKLLQRLVPDLHELSQDAVYAYAANSFVSGKDILVHSAVPQDFKDQLKQLKMRIHEVDISEFKKAGGGIHCLINVLE